METGNPEEGSRPDFRAGRWRKRPVLQQFALKAADHRPGSTSLIQLANIQNEAAGLAVGGEDREVALASAGHPVAFVVRTIQARRQSGADESLYV